MVRLMLVLAPVMCILSGIALSHLMIKYAKKIENPVPAKQIDTRKQKKLEQKTDGVSSKTSHSFIAIITLSLFAYSYHCIWVTSEAYSSPSIVLSARSHDGERIIFDDFREAYYWLQMNTPEVRLQIY